MNDPNTVLSGRLARREFPAPARRDRTLRDIAHDVTPSIVRVWRELLARKWLILVTATLLTAITAYVLSTMTPIYRSTATVLVEQSKAKFVGIDEIYGAIATSREYFTTQEEYLRSRDVALRVVRKLGLTAHREFDVRQMPPPLWQRVLPAQIVETLRPRREPDAARVEAAAVKIFQSRLFVAPIRLSQLIHVGFTSTDPEFAADVANETAMAYIASDLEARFAVTQQASVWLSSRLRDLKEKLDASERALQGYRERAGIADTKGLALGGQTKQVEELTQKLIDARVKRTQAEESFRQVHAKRADRYNVTAIINHPGVAAAKAAEAAAEKRFAEAREKFGPAFPTYKEAQKELEVARANSRRQADAVISSLETEFRGAVAAERAIESALKSMQGTVQVTNRKEIDLGNYEREVSTNKQLYETFLSRVKETHAAGDLQSPVARLVDPAVPEFERVSPKVLQGTLIALVCSLFGGAALALLLNRLDSTIKTTDAVEQLLGKPMLGAIPRMSKREAARLARKVVDDPNSAFSESVRAVSTAIMLSTLDVMHKIVSVASSLPGEGKSTFAINFALAQANTKRVLLLDCDLRRPVLGKRLELREDAAGLAEVLAGTTPLADAIQRPSDSTLDVIAAGKAGKVPIDLLSTAGFAKFLDEVSVDYDLVVMDCPPLQLVADALVIGAQSTGLVYVVAAGRTPVSVVQRNLKRLEDGGIALLGVVLNGHDYTRAERYYGEYSGYSQYGSAYYGSERR